MATEEEDSYRMYCLYSLLDNLVPLNIAYSLVIVKKAFVRTAPLVTRNVVERIFTTSILSHLQQKSFTNV